jgi:E3 ubiquitin-protein ligase SHPRH
MGQTRPTEVYCYYAEGALWFPVPQYAHPVILIVIWTWLDTVERNILDLAARKGLSLYTKDKAAGTLDTTSFSQENDQNAIDAPAKKKTQKGDFIFKIDDMLAVLFPHMYEDVEYLIPEEESGGLQDVEMADGTSTPSVAADSRPSPRIQSNAVAGPSRIVR